jgi:uncharacterized repeat protein (TIGR02543 family)
MKQFTKKLTSLFLAVCMILTAAIVAMPITASAATSISSWDQITSATGDYVLTSNITVPAGGTFASTFTGTLDGNGHTITVADTMFAKLGGGATLKNFTVVASGTTNFTPVAFQVAAATSSSPISIENVTVDVDIDTSVKNDTNDKTVASFIAIVPGVTTYIEMTNCVSLGKIDSDNQVGAFIGRTNATDMTAVLIDCVNRSNIYTTNSYAGGFIGMLDTSKHTVSFKRCINYGNVEATGSDAGGFLACASGSNNDVITFTDCANFGAITNHKTGSTDPKYNAGGFLPRVDNAASVTFTNCLSAAPTYSAEIKFASYFCNYNEVGTVTRTNCYFVANLPSGYTSNESASTAGMTQVTAAQLASGEVAYKLNGSSQVDPDWYQLIGTDATPHHTASDKAIVRYDSAAGKYTNDYVYLVTPKFDITLDANYGTYSVYNFNTGANENFTGIKVDVYVTNIASNLTYGIAGIDGYLNFDGNALTPYYTTAEELNGTKGAVNPGPVANFPTYTQTVAGTSFQLFSVEGLCTNYVAGSGSLRMNYIIDVDNHAAWASSKTGFKTADAVKLSYYFSVNGTVNNGDTYTFEVPANPDATTTADATLRAPYYTGKTDQNAFDTVFGRGADTTCTIQTTSSYTVTFVDYNGNVLKTETVAAGGSATPPATPSREGYDFVNWDGAYTSVYSNTTVTAVYAVKTYTVTFWADGAKIGTDTVEHGGTAVAPTTPSKTGYTFTGWNVALTNIKADTNAVATFAAKTYTVRFVDYNGTELSKQTVAHGGNAVAPANPTRTGYTFAGWDVSYNNITKDTTVTATYTAKTYTVNFKDYDGTILKTQTVSHGGSATAPANPTRDGYTFAGWDVSYNNITANTNVMATYTKNTAPAEFFVFASGADTTYISIDETNGYLVFKAGGKSFNDICALFVDSNISIVKANGAAVTGTSLAGTKCTITSTINGVSKSLTIVVKGDLNSDGKINTLDCNIANKHSKGTSLLTDAVLLYTGNVNNLAGINVLDYNIINKYSKGLNTHF